MFWERRESSPPKTQGIGNSSKNRYWTDDGETYREDLERWGTCTKSHKLMARENLQFIDVLCTP